MRWLLFEMWAYLAAAFIFGMAVYRWVFGGAGALAAEDLSAELASVRTRYEEREMERKRLRAKIAELQAQLDEARREARSNEAEAKAARIELAALKTEADIAERTANRERRAAADAAVAEDDEEDDEVRDGAHDGGERLEIVTPEIVEPEILPPPDPPTPEPESDFKPESAREPPPRREPRPPIVSRVSDLDPAPPPSVPPIASPESSPESPPKPPTVPPAAPSLPSGSGSASEPATGSAAEPASGAPQVESVSFMAALREGAPDDLTKIRGIGQKLETTLNTLGIYYYRQIADWTDGEVAAMNAKLRFPGRIERDRWREQARSLLGRES